MTTISSNRRTNFFANKIIHNSIKVESDEGYHFYSDSMIRFEFKIKESKKETMYLFIKNNKIIEDLILISGINNDNEEFSVELTYNRIAWYYRNTDALTTVLDFIKSIEEELENNRKEK